MRRAAGTDAVLDDPAEHIKLATKCEAWAAERGEQLFPNRDWLTVSSFFEKQYKPMRMSDAAEGTHKLYVITVRRWILLTGDPPLAEVSNEMVARYRDALMRMPNGRGGKLSPNSVRMHMTHLQAILDKAGPSGPRNRDAAGVIDKSPWAKPPRELVRVPQIVSTEQLEAVYAAADGAMVPGVVGVRPSDWWRALLAVAYNTALRAGSLFAMRFDWIDWKRCELTIPPESMKTRRYQIVPLNEVAIEHLESIRTDRELVFEWNLSDEYRRKVFHDMQDAAGIERADHFGLHALRRTAATALWAHSPQAAQLVLGHSTIQMTRNHYVQGAGIVAEAVDSLPQPAAFRKAGAA